MNRDQQVLAAISTFWQKHDYAPTLEEVAEEAGLFPPENYKSAMFYACQRLVGKGKLEEVTVPFGKRRGYRVADHADSTDQA